MSKQITDLCLPDQRIKKIETQYSQFPLRGDSPPTNLHQYYFYVSKTSDLPEKWIAVRIMSRQFPRKRIKEVYWDRKSSSACYFTAAEHLSRIFRLSISLRSHFVLFTDSIDESILCEAAPNGNVRDVLIIPVEYGILNRTEFEIAVCAPVGELTGRTLIRTVNICTTDPIH